MGKYEFLHQTWIVLKSFLERKGKGIKRKGKKGGKKREGAGDRDKE